jgi:RNA recognition motif-containing protein
MNTRLYVGNLSFQTTEDALQRAFAQCGSVAEVKVVLDRETGRSRGFAFVSMATAEDAKKAMETMDGTELDGRTLRVKEAEERRPGGGGGGPRGGGGGGFGRREGGGGGPRGDWAPRGGGGPGGGPGGRDGGRGGRDAGRGGRGGGRDFDRDDRGGGRGGRGGGRGDW